MKRIPLVLIALAPGLLAQAAFYPGVDLPLETPLSDQVSGPAPQGLPLADATFFTSTPHELVRDLDGDAHLDATWLRDGLWVFRGHGDGRFDGTFQAPQVLTATVEPTGRWGDVTSDGRADAVFLSPKSIEVFVDQGDGSFTSSGLVMLVWPGIQETSWGIGDANADGKNDILFASEEIGGFDYALTFMPGMGDGTFAPPRQLALLDDKPTNMAVGDINGDGRADAVFAQNMLGTLYNLQVVTVGPGAIGVAHPQVPALVYPASLQMRDMTGDTLPDVLVAEGHTLLIFPGDGAGNLAATPQLVPGAGNESVFADVDGDGLVDVIASDGQEAQALRVLFATPQGTLAPPVVTPHCAPPLDTGDFDGDGQMDLFSSRTVLLGRADGHFLAPRAFDLGAAAELPSQAQFADFNGDGRSDVLSVEFAEFNAFVARSEPGGSWGAPLPLATGNKLRACAAGDLDGDGDADVLAGWWLGGKADTWIGNGQGGFASGPQVNMGSFVEMTVLGIGRFDSSAPPDLVAASDDLLVVRRGLGGLQFAAAQTKPLQIPNLMDWIVVSDLDGDDLDDLVLGVPTPQVYHCIGHGNFAAPVAVGGPARAMTVHDVDGDGQLDLVASTNFEEVIVHLQQDSSWVPAPFPHLTSTREVLSTALADVNGDGLLDIALGHRAAWSLHLGVPGGGWAPEPVDFFDLTGDGVAMRFEDTNADGLPDLLTVGGGLTSETVPTHWLGLSLSLHQLGPWADAGFALQSPSGEPWLWPAGTLQPGSPIGLVVRDARPNAPVTLIVGLGPGMTAFKGGTLVPDPLLVLGLGLTTGVGMLTLESPWPGGVPSGSQLWMQAWIKDAAGVAGYAATNGVSGTAP